MHTPEPLIPNNPLEVAILAANRGEISFENLLLILFENEIVVRSATRVHETGLGLTPLVFQKEGAEMIAIFTSSERAEKYAEVAKYSLTMNAARFFRGFPPGFGIVVNPGFAVGFDLTAQGIENIRKDFLSPKGPYL